jgi:hypothetical protein
MAGLPEDIARSIDAGVGLSEQHLRQLLDDAAAGAAGLIAAVNAVPAAAGGAAAGPRVFVNAAAASAKVLMPDLIEEHLILPNVKGAVVIFTENLQPLKRRRASTLPDGVSYEGNSFPGRHVAGACCCMWHRHLLQEARAAQ